MVRIDMSEFMEKHSVARLIGAPPGYVGYEEGGYLTEAVRRKPYSVVLLDEVEKAHPDVFNVLLQVLDDGRLTDGQGRTVDFRNTVIVMTSNLGQPAHSGARGRRELRAHEGRGHGNRRPALPARVHQSHRRRRRVPSARAGAHPQDRRHPARVLCGGGLRERDIELVLDAGARDRLAQAGFDPVYGARPLKRAIQQQLENPLAQRILRGDFGPGDTIRVVADGDGARVHEGREGASRVRSGAKTLCADLRVSLRCLRAPPRSFAEDDRGAAAQVPRLRQVAADAGSCRRRSSA